MTNESSELLPQKKIKLSDLRGKFKTGLSIEEIEKQLKELRDEWDRDFSDIRKQ